MARPAGMIPFSVCTADRESLRPRATRGTEPPGHARRLTPTPASPLQPTADAGTYVCRNPKSSS